MLPGRGSGLSQQIKKGERDKIGVGGRVWGTFPFLAAELGQAGARGGSRGGGVPLACP